MDLLSPAHHSRYARHGDDAPSLPVDRFLRAHDSCDGLSDIERAGEIDVLRHLPEGGGEGEEGVERAYTGVGDEAVYPGEGGKGHGDYLRI